jgi:uncharacterized repeat protein (TIGR02543 family)
MYTITFNSNGGTTFTDLTEQTALPDLLPTPTKAGYTFVAWYIDSALTTRAVAGATIEEDTTLYAKWHNLGSLFTEIANAIREKESSSGTIRDVDFGERVKQIQGTTASDANAVVGDVLSGKTFYAGNTTRKTGTMTNRGTVNTDITTKAQEVTIANGYHSGSGIVKISATEQAKIISTNIRSGVTILGQAGASSVVNTSDADATASDIASGKTAYVNGSKLTGSLVASSGVTIPHTNDYKEVTLDFGYSGGTTLKLMAVGQANGAGMANGGWTQLVLTGNSKSVTLKTYTDGASPNIAHFSLVSATMSINELFSSTNDNGRFIYFLTMLNCPTSFTYTYTDDGDYINDCYLKSMIYTSTINLTNASGSIATTTLSNYDILAIQSYEND